MALEQEPAWPGAQQQLKAETCGALLKEGVETLEPLRAAWCEAVSAQWGFSGAAGLTALLLLILAPNYPIAWLTVAGLAALLAWGLSSKSRRLHKDLCDQFNGWRDNVIREMDKEASLMPSHCHSQAAFNDSWLNDAFYNTYGGHNFLSIGNASCSQLSVQNIYTETYYVTVSTTDSKGNTTYHQEKRARTMVVPVFDGLFMVMPAPLPYPGTVVLRPKLEGRRASLHVIRTASSKLTNNYCVGASDRFIGHRALTPSLLVALWDFRQLVPCQPSFSYRDGRLFVVLPKTSLSFGQPPGLWRPVAASSLRKVVDDCEHALSFLKNAVKNLMPK